MAEVVLAGVSKTFEGGVEAVAGVDLRVRDGELMVLLGPSGSGKSTLLRLIAGLEEITAGEISIGGRLVNRLHPRDRDVAMVFQDYALYPHMSVAANIGFSLRLRRVPREEVRRRVEHVAAMLGIEALLDRKPQALSGGQQQRVALGRAIVREPAVFLFDEPLSNLDARLRLETRSEMKALQRRLKATMIHVTHDQEEALTLGDRVAVLCQGRLQQVGTPLEVYRAPSNRFVAAFIGSPPMSFLEGTLLEGGAGGLVFAEAGAGSDRADALTLPRSWESPMRRFVGRAVVLGLRPTALREPGAAGAGGPKLLVQVDHVEAVGEWVDLVGTTRRGERVVARLPAREAGPEGGVVALTLDMERAHAFEPGPFGRNLLGPAA
jgi:multiple sugar transport system ATP-binding protein